jgi:hypothetical protein
MAYNAVSRYQRFEGTYCLHHQIRNWRQYVPPKSWQVLTSLHGIPTERMKTGNRKIPPFTSVVRKFKHLMLEDFALS